MSTHQGLPQPQRDGQGGIDTGPRNVELDLQNPDMLTQPETDSGTVPNMKFSFGTAHTRIEEGGRTREITQRELPIATTLAGVDQEGRNFLDDVVKGDLWFFPKGVPHYIQAPEEGVEFLLVFDDGGFSVNSTFMISDFFAHTPKSVLATNFGWTPEQMANMPEKEKYIFQGEVPPSLESDRVISPTGDVPSSFKHRMLSQAPQHFKGGSVRSTSGRATSATCRSPTATTSRTSATSRWCSWRCSATRSSRTSRPPSGWPTCLRRSAPTR